MLVCLFIDISIGLKSEHNLFTATLRCDVDGPFLAEHDIGVIVVCSANLSDINVPLLEARGLTIHSFPPRGGTLSQRRDITIYNNVFAPMLSTLNCLITVMCLEYIRGCLLCVLQPWSGLRAAQWAMSMDTRSSITVHKQRHCAAHNI